MRPQDGARNPWSATTAEFRAPTGAHHSLRKTRGGSSDQPRHSFRHPQGKCKWRNTLGIDSLTTQLLTRHDLEPSQPIRQPFYIRDKGRGLLTRPSWTTADNS